MAVESTQKVPHLRTPRVAAKSLRSLALVALGLTAPAVADAQHHSDRRHQENVPAAVVTTPTCALLTGVHTRAEWIRNAQALGTCFESIQSQLAAIAPDNQATDAQRSSLMVRAFDAYADMATAYAYAQVSASDFSPESIAVEYEIPLHLHLGFYHATIDACQRFASRMITVGNMLQGTARRGDIPVNKQRQLLTLALHYHSRAINALRSAQSSDTRGDRSPATLAALDASLAQARNHTGAEWMTFAEVSMEHVERLNQRIGPAMVAAPNATQEATSAVAAEYYVQALTGYVIGLTTASDRRTHPMPALDANTFRFTPRTNYGAGEWSVLAGGLSSLGNHLAGHIEANPETNLVLNRSARFELALRAAESSLHAVIDARNSAGLRPEARLALEFNVRSLAATLMEVTTPPDLPRVMPVGATAATVAEVQRSLEVNNERRRTNLRRAGELITLSPTDKDRLRVVLINWLRLQDKVLTTQLRILQNSLRSIGREGVRVCEANTTLSGDNLRILRDFVCPPAGTITFEGLANIATNPALTAQLPERLLGQNGRPHGANELERNELITASLFSGNAPQDVTQALGTIYRTWYLLYYAHFTLERLDRDIATRTNTQPLLSTIRLTNPITNTAAALGELTVSDPVSRAVITEPVNPNPADTQRPVVTSLPVAGPRDTPQWRDYLARRAAWDRRVSRWRLAGVIVGGTGAVAGGIGLGINIAAYNDISTLLEQPQWQANIAEARRLRADVEAGRATPEQVNPRLAELSRQLHAERDRLAGPGEAGQVVAIAGASLAVIGGALALLAPILAGPAPVEPRQDLAPATPGATTPHPRGPGRAEGSGSGNTVMPGLAVTPHSVSGGVTIAF